MKVGVFDSGIGGLSVLHCARKMMPQTDFIYYADEAHVPYGEKKPEEIRTFLNYILNFMLEKQVDAIVIACNTATSVLTMEYRKQFPVPIVGMEPAVKKAVDLYSKDNKRILVAATPITIKGRKLKDLVLRCDTQQEVDLIALPGLVHFAEKGDFTDPAIEAYLRQELEKYTLSDYGTVVLGCTHFNYFKEILRKIFGEQIHFLDGNEGTIRQLARVTDHMQFIHDQTDQQHLVQQQLTQQTLTQQQLAQQQTAATLEASGTQGASVEYYISGELAQGEELHRIEQYLKQLDKMFWIH